MARYDSSANLLRLANMLQNARNGLHLKQIARELDCCERTVRRYLEAMASKNGHYPVYSEQTDRGTVWKMLPMAREAFVPIQFNEVAALVLARKLLEGSGEDSALTDALDSILGKLKSQRTQDFSLLVKNFEESVVRTPADTRPPTQIFRHSKIVMEAIRKRLKLEFDYANAQGKSTRARRVAPFAFIISEGRVYLVAHCYLRGAIRQFVPERMENVRLTDEPVREQFDFDAEAYAKSSLGGFHAEPQEILMRVVPWIAEYFSRTLSFPEMELFEQDGAHYLRFRLGLNWSLVWWLSQFGPNIEVLEPLELREWLAEFLEAAAEQYRD